MLMAQITDLHIGFDGQDKPDLNTARFQQVLDHMNTLSVQPDLYLFTGDLVESGRDWAYDRVKKMCAPLKAPCYFAMGNHDNRAAFEAVFKTGLIHDGFLNYSVEKDGLRILVLDTLEPGKHGAGFNETCADWLAKELASHPESPTLIVMHHPPIETGIGWLTASSEDEWVKRFRAVIAPYSNIVQIIAGHIHRNISQRCEQSFVTVTHAVAPKVSFDLAPIDPNTPDNRVLLSDALGGYALHHWHKGVLTTHSIQLPEGRPIVQFDADHAWVVQHTLDLSD